MQIYYCDACGLRVNNSELVPAGDKVYCHACAQKQVPVTSPPRRTPSGGNVLPQRPKTDGYAIPTPLRGHAATQRPPSPASGSNYGSGNHPVYPSSGTHRATSGNERPRTGHTAAISRPASSSGRATNAKATDNSTMIYAGAGAGVMLLVVVLVFAMRGSPAPDTQANAKKDPPKPVEVTTTKTVTPPVVVQPPEPPKRPTDGGMDDIRERNARREFDDAVRRVKEAGGDVLSARRAMSDFVRRYRSTEAGKEGVAYLEKLATASGRSSDSPASTQPGLKVELYERPNDWDEIRNRDLRSLKKYKDMTLDKIDLTGAQVEQTFARREYLGAVITGFIEVPADGDYTLSLTSDDGSFLLIGDWRVVENDGSHAATNSGGTVPLKKGKHRFRINYSQGSGEAALQFFWSGPNIPRQIVPPNVLSHEP